MTPLLQRIYQSEGGSEVLDTLMKYIYKGMAQGPPAGGATTKTPQAGGFSQISGRNFGGAEGGGQTMSVLLSWHEKVSRSFAAYIRRILILTANSLSNWLAQAALSESCRTGERSKASIACDNCVTKVSGGRESVDVYDFHDQTQ